ncbi:MAG: hypothetical protein WA446_01105 [Steroidobacteraceae bacterium]
MFARIPRFVVIAAPVFFALTMASSANAAGAACPTLKCVSCQKQCYKAYQKEFFQKITIPRHYQYIKSNIGNA